MPLMMLNEIHWGSVPAWIAAAGSLLASLSLVLAFLVFRRDRENAERAQVDRLGAWATATYERRFPDIPNPPRVEVGEVTGHVRNGSELPVRVVYLKVLVETRWLVEDKAQSQPRLPVWESGVRGTEPLRQFVDDLLVPPGETNVCRPRSTWRTWPRKGRSNWTSPEASPRTSTGCS